MTMSEKLTEEQILELRIDERYGELYADEKAKRRLASESYKSLTPVPIGEMVKHIAPTDWLIEDYIEFGTVGYLSGEYQTGKSFLALDWACCVAAGKNWLGREVPRAGNVLYVAAEGGSGIGKRAAAWQTYYETTIEDARFSFFDEPVQFASEQAVDDVGKAVQEMEIDFLIIDTFAQSTRGLSENESRDVGVFTSACYRLRDCRGPTATTVLVVDHLGKDAKRGTRGHSSKIGDVDFNFEVRKIKDVRDRWILHCDKLKDDRHPDDWGFALHQVEFVTGIRSCVIKESETDTLLATPAFNESQGVTTIHDYLGARNKAQNRKVRHGRKEEVATERMLDAIDRLGINATDRQLADELGITHQAVNKKRRKLL
jgi:hypothetical protein